MRWLIHLVFLVAFIFLWVTSLIKSFSLSKEVFLTVLLVVPLSYIQCIIFPTIQIINKRLLHLKDVFKISLFIYIVLSFLQIVNEATQLNYSAPPLSIDLNYAFIILVYFCVGIFMVDLGANSFRKRVVNHEMPRNKSVPYKPAIFLLLVVTALFSLTLSFAGLTGYASSTGYTQGIYSSIKNLADILTPIALVSCSYLVFSQKRRLHFSYRILFYMSFASHILIGIISGMKELALLPVISVGIVYVLSGLKIRISYIVVGCFALLLLYPITNAYRDSINAVESTNLQRVSVLISSISSLFESNENSDLFSESVSSYQSRISQYAWFHDAVMSQESWEYYGDMTRYLGLPIYAFVPRAIWPDKPRSDIGAHYYYLLTDRMNNSVTVTSMGWAYLEGGIFYLSLIMFLMGFLFEFIERRRNRSIVYLVIYVHAFLLAIKPEWDPFFALSGSIQLAIVAFIILTMINSRKQRYKFHDVSNRVTRL